MKNDPNNIIQQYSNIAVFVTKHIASLWPQAKVKKWLSLFNVKLSAIVVTTQHMLIVTKGSEDFLHGIKEPLARLAADIAQLMKVLSGKKSGRWRKLPTISTLMDYTEDDFMKECLLIYTIANKLMLTLERKGLTLQMINTLKSAIDVYNAVIPAPKAAKIAGQHYRQTINTMMKEAADILQEGLDPAVFEAAARKPDILIAYKNLRS